MTTNIIVVSAKLAAQGHWLNVCVGCLPRFKAYKVDAVTR